MLPLARRWRWLADRALGDLGLSNSLGWTLIHLSRSGGDVKQTDLADALEISDPSLVRLLDQLGAAGLVTRTPDPRDRRIRRVALTPAGHERLTAVEAVLARLRRRLLAGVDDADLAVTLAVLERIGEAVRGAEDDRD